MVTPSEKSRGAGGMLAKAADKNTSIPDGTGNFTSFINKPSIDGSTVVFRGKGSSSQEGIYSYSSGSLATIVDTNDAIPGGTGNFEITFLPVIDGGNVAFRGNGSGGQQGFILVSAAPSPCSRRSRARPSPTRPCWIASTANWFPNATGSTASAVRTARPTATASRSYGR